MLEFTIPVNPRSKKNSQNIIFNRRTGKRMIVQNERYTEFEKACKQYIPELENPINYPTNLQCHFYVCDARKRDIANYIEAIQDVLVKYKLYEDDNYKIISSLDGCKMEIDRENPHIDIQIKRLD